MLRNASSRNDSPWRVGLPTLLAALLAVGCSGDSGPSQAEIDAQAKREAAAAAAAAVHARGQRIRRRCFVADQRRIIMPAFGSYTGALSVRSEAFNSLLGDFHVWMIGAKAIHRFPASAVR